VSAPWISPHTVQAASVAGYALSFGNSTGSDDFVEILNESGKLPSGNAARTLEFWAQSFDGKGQDLSLGHNSDHIVNYGEATDNHAFGAMLYIGDTWWFYAHNKDVNDINTAFPADTNWHFHTISYDGSTVRYYLDGELKKSDLRHLETVSDNLFFGIRPDIDLGNTFNGLLDEVRIWNETLSQPEIKADMSLKLTGNEPGLVGYWNFDENGGQVIRDSSPNHLDGRRGSTDGDDANDPVWVVSDVPVMSKGVAIDYFALGDSIASGHGLIDDTQFGASATGCRRALTNQHPAYPLRVAKDLERRYSDVNFMRLPGDPFGRPPIDNFFACSGASAGQPDQSELNKSPYKWLHNQVDAILPKIRQVPSTHHILVSITIGANDFGWADIDFLSQLLNKSSKDYKLYVKSVTSIVRRDLRNEITRLLKAHPNVKIVVTQYHNPFNPQSIIWLKYPGVLNCLNPKASLGCYARTEEYGVHALNDAIKRSVSDVNQPSRVAVTSDDLHAQFHQHSSPGDPAFPLWACGSAGPNFDDTWIQYPSDPNSNSDPDIPDWLRQLVGPWHGDCFHPNDKGTLAYADAVNQAALSIGR